MSPCTYAWAATSASALICRQSAAGIAKSPPTIGKGNDPQHGSDTGAGDCVTDDTDRSVDGIHAASPAGPARLLTSACNAFPRSERKCVFDAPASGHPQRLFSGSPITLSCRTKAQEGSLSSESSCPFHKADRVCCIASSGHEFPEACTKRMSSRGDLMACCLLGQRLTHPSIERPSPGPRHQSARESYNPPAACNPWPAPAYHSVDQAPWPYAG